MKTFILVGVSIVLAMTAGVLADVVADRGIPQAGPDHPGNVYLEGEMVSVVVPGPARATARRWRLLDDAGKVVADREYNTGDEELTLGKLGLGWYRVEFVNADGATVGWTTTAVLRKLAEPVGAECPVCVDSATSWFAYGNPAKQERFAHLAALAGVNWIRDRLSWGQIQDGPGAYHSNTTYDSAATIQAGHGLQVLQVYHDTAGFATDKQLDGDNPGMRFPRDLRMLYRFDRDMAKRFKGRVLAWEPWNEANITVFGGHTTDEMCSLQKAAYLGFNAGNPDVKVCWNVYAGSGGPLYTEGVLKNEAWPYFETYDIHSYRPYEEYADRFAVAREAACGRQLWITECGVPLKYKADDPEKELSHEDELKQARFIAKSYASSLFAGVSKHFFFILGNYPEGVVQFGLLRKDQTPRPGYSALAAVGRFLADGRCLGRLKCDDAKARVYAFATRCDGADHDVLIAWADGGAAWPIRQAARIEGIYDYFGRPIDEPQRLDDQAVFVVMGKGAASRLGLEAPLKCSGPREGAVSTVVMQLQMPKSATDLDQQAHRIGTGRSTVDVFVYNFGKVGAEGTVLLAEKPQGWKFDQDKWQVKVGPMGRAKLAVGVEPPADAGDKGQWIRMVGTFGDAGRSVLAFRLLAK